MSYSADQYRVTLEHMLANSREHHFVVQKAALRIAARVAEEGFITMTIAEADDELPITRLTRISDAIRRALTDPEDMG